jgi:hypothetical protein
MDNEVEDVAFSSSSEVPCAWGRVRKIGQNTQRRPWEGQPGREHLGR